MTYKIKKCSNLFFSFLIFAYNSLTIIEYTQNEIENWYNIIVNTWQKIPGLCGVPILVWRLIRFVSERPRLKYLSPKKTVKTKFLKTHPLLNFIVLLYIHFYLFWFAITIRVTFKTRLFPRISFAATYYCACALVYVCVTVVISLVYLSSLWAHKTLYRT